MSTKLTYQGRYLKWQTKFATYGFDPITEAYIAGMTTPPTKEHQMVMKERTVKRNKGRWIYLNEIYPEHQAMFSSYSSFILENRPN